MNDNAAEVHRYQVDVLIGPCDSYRPEFDMRAATLHDAKVKLRRIVDEPIFELLVPSEALAVLEALDA